MSNDALAVLVVAAQGGDRQAFDQLIHECSVNLYRFALMKMRNSTAANELIHETFVRAWLKLHLLHKPQAFRGWIKQICHRLFLDKITGRKVHQLIEEVAEKHPSSEVEPVDYMMREELEANLYTQIDRLDEPFHNTFTLYYLRGKSINEISQDNNTPKGTIRRRLHTARNKLKQQLVSSK